MSKEIYTQIRINASPEKVWAVLTDFDSYSEWNPFIKSIKGHVQVGNRIEAEIQNPSSKPMIFKPVVLAFEKNKVFTWLGHLFFSGLFDGQHHFEIVDNKDGTVTFIQSEKFKGILVPLFKSMLDTKTIKGFESMNESLKAVCEKG